jgi:DNA replication and repair protein RecF
MKLEWISLQNFRNYEKVEAELNSDLVLILGNNAAGKTNLLESIYFLSRLKSFRAPDQILAKHQSDHFNLKAKIGNDRLEVIVQVEPGLKRLFKINDQKTKRGFWQAFPVVLFAPNDLNLFDLGPLLRRRFLDETLGQLDLEYSANLTSLDHILKQKSALLEMIYQGQAQRSELEFWNQQLAPVASRLTLKRQEFVDHLNSKLTNKINELTDFKNNFVLKYKRSDASSESEFLQSLIDHTEAEVRSGKNLIGPHRDDFTIEKNELLNLHNSSRGELRAQVLALKLLQAEYLGQTGKRPVVLLDDVFSELDEIRRTRLIENLRDHQIFITSTEDHKLSEIVKEARVIRIEDNQIN